MRESLKQGSNFWNAGELYGTPDRNSLHLLREYFDKYPEDSQKVFLSIKGGFKPGTMEMDGSQENVKRSIEECLSVLDGRKFIDLFECARVDPNVPIEQTIGCIAEYVKAGKIGAIGLSEASASNIRKAAKVHPIAVVEVEVSLWSTHIFDSGVAETCADLGIPIIAYSPLGQGFLVRTNVFTLASFINSENRLAGFNPTRICKRSTRHWHTIQDSKRMSLTRI